MGEVAMFGAASGATNFGAAYAQNQSLRAQSDYEKRMTGVNSGWAEMRAQGALKQGDFQAAQAHRYGESVASSQKAIQGAGNIDINQGSAAQVRAETEAMASLDALAARNNAFKEFMGIKADDAAAVSAAKMNRIARRSAGRQAIIAAGAATAKDIAIADYYSKKNSGKNSGKGSDVTYGNNDGYGD